MPGIPPRLVRRRTGTTGVLHVAAVGLAVGAAALAGLIDGWTAWLVGGFAATAVYLAVAAAERMLADAVASVREP